jgi:DNA-binding ferritin-like protein (Dps family)
MATKWIELVTGSFEDKKRWRRYKARTKQLPENYRTAAEAVERYLMFFGRVDGDAATMFEDLIEMFEQSAADETPIRELFGTDPVEFVETFLRNYEAGSWIVREQDRLTKAIDRAAGESRADR